MSVSSMVAGSPAWFRRSTNLETSACTRFPNRLCARGNPPFAFLHWRGSESAGNPAASGQRQTRPYTYWHLVTEDVHLKLCEPGMNPYGFGFGKARTDSLVAPRRYLANHHA